jgi:hypothetical protein
MVDRLAPGLAITVNETVHKDGRRSSVRARSSRWHRRRTVYLLVATARCLATSLAVDQDFLL